MLVYDIYTYLFIYTLIYVIMFDCDLQLIFTD